MNSRRLLDGVYPVLPTTFDAFGELDLGLFRRLVRFVVETGAQGMLVLGVMGEAPKLLPGERAAAVQEAGAGAAAVLIARLANEVSAITAVKLEDPPTPQKVTMVRERAPEGFRIFGGIGGVFLLEELHRGANGTMTGFAFLELLVEIHRAYAAGCEREAAETFFRYLPLIRFELQEAIGIAMRKRIYRLRGVIADDHVRAPSSRVDDLTAAELDELVAFTGLSLAPTTVC